MTVGADGRERLVDADEVARAVVDDRDPRRGAHPSEPFVDATPLASRIGLDGVAQRAAERLERGLGEVVVVAAGAAKVERGARGPGERLEGVLDELERQPADALAAERQVDDRVRAAADVDDGRGDRFVHRHGAVAEAADAGPIAERLGERPSPSTSATSSTVWCSSTCRSPSAWMARSNRPWWANEPSRWS